MPHVRAALRQRVELDGGITVDSQSWVNVDVTLPLAAAALAAGLIIVADSASPPPQPAPLLFQGIAPPGINPIKRVATTPITGFQTGHGFFSSGSGGTVFNLNDTSSHLNGSQCATVTTDGAAGSAYIKKNSISPLIDTTGKMVRVWIKLPNPADIANLAAVYMYLGTDNVVANYYSINSLIEGFSADYYGNDYANALDGWMGIIMTFGECVVTGAPTRNSINSIWLKAVDAHGQKVTVQFGGIELIPEPSAGAVCFTFDDSRLTQYTQALPKLQQYRFPATAYIIRDVVDSALGLPDVPQPSYMSTAQIKELQDYNDWAICAHADTVAAHNMPNGDDDLTITALEREFEGITSWLFTNGFRGYQHYALPKGKHNQAVYNLSKKYFKSSRTTFSLASGGGWIKHESFPPTDANKLVPFYVYGNTPLANMTAAVDSAFANKEFLIFVFHDLVTTPDASYLDTQAKLADFNSLVDYVATKGIQVRTVPSVIEHGM